MPCLRSALVSKRVRSPAPLGPGRRLRPEKLRRCVGRRGLLLPLLLQKPIKVLRYSFEIAVRIALMSLLHGQVGGEICNLREVDHVRVVF